MGLFDRLFKKEKTEEITFPLTLGATAKGTLVSMENIPDEVFSTGVLGICCGIDPSEGKVFAPINGKVVQLADTLHAVGIEGDGGVEVLIHVGVDTVEMNGDGFSGKVKEGDFVKKGQLLLTMDIKKIHAANHPATVINIITNSGDFASVECIASGNVEPGTDMLRINK